MLALDSPLIYCDFLPTNTLVLSCRVERMFHIFSKREANVVFASM